MSTCYPFILSGHTKQATEQLVTAFRDYLEKTNESNKDKSKSALRNISYTLSCRRSQFATRAAMIANSKEGNN